MLKAWSMIWTLSPFLPSSQLLPGHKQIKFRNSFDVQKAQRVAVMDQARCSPVRHDCILPIPLYNSTSHIHSWGFPPSLAPEVHANHANFTVNSKFPLILSKIYCSGAWPFPVLHSLRWFSLLSTLQSAQTTICRAVYKRLMLSSSHGRESMPAHCMAWNGE